MRILIDLNFTHQEHQKVKKERGHEARASDFSQVLAVAFTNPSSGGGASPRNEACATPQKNRGLERANATQICVHETSALHACHPVSEVKERMNSSGHVCLDTAHEQTRWRTRAVTHCLRVCSRTSLKGEVEIALRSFFLAFVAPCALVLQRSSCWEGSVFLSS